MVYVSEAEIEAIIGYLIDATGNSRPSTAQLTQMITNAGAIINAEARVTSDLTDTSGRLRVIATSLVQKMINNLFAISSPEMYAFVEVELTDDQKRIIHMEHSIWQSLTFEVGL